jgi:hypothetical protein
MFLELELREFSAVDDSGRFLRCRAPVDFEGARYACGLFDFGRAT